MRSSPASLFSRYEEGSGRGDGAALGRGAALLFASTWFMGGVAGGALLPVVATDIAFELRLLFSEPSRW